MSEYIIHQWSPQQRAVQAESWREAVTLAQESCPECITVESQLLIQPEPPIDQSSLLITGVGLLLCICWLWHNRQIRRLEREQEVAMLYQRQVKRAAQYWARWRLRGGA